MDVNLSKPQKSALKVPLGRILVNHKWRGSTLSKELDSSDCRVSFSDGLGFVDFVPAEQCFVVYITEADLLTPRSYTEKVKLHANLSPRGIIIVDECCSAAYQDFQDLACIDCGLTVFPVAHQNEIPRVLRALTFAESRQSNNPFKSSTSLEESMEKEQLSILKQIPGIGHEKAVLLLKSFGHITCISKLSEERLTFKIGEADAKKVVTYFRNKIQF